MKLLRSALTACLLTFSDMALRCAAQAEPEQSKTASSEESEVKEPHIFADKENLGIYMNKYVDRLTEVWEKSDKLSLLYIFDSERTIDANGQNWGTLDLMFFKVLEELKAGYVDTYAIDCAVEHPVVDKMINLKNVCEKEEFQPVFQLYKPPEMRINPYTGKDMPLQVIQFASNQVTDPDVKRWIIDNIPDYTQRLSTKADAEQFAEETGIQKVYLFSAKQKVPPIYKALSASFRNRLRFAFVNVEGQVATDLAKDFSVEKWPTLLVQNQFVTADDDSDKHHVFSGKMKLEELVDFVVPFALAEADKKEERVIKSKSQTSINQEKDASGYQIITSTRDLEERVLDDWRGGLVYVAKKDQMPHLDIIEAVASEYGYFLNVALFAVDDADITSAELKQEFKSGKLPQLRFYPNLKTGTEKRSASYEIVMPSTDSQTDRFSTVMEEIESGFETDVKNVDEKVYYSLGTQHAKDGKVVVLLMYEGGTQMDFAYKALSADPYLQDDFIFMAVDDPPESLRKENTLPAIEGLMPIDEENPTPRVFAFQGLVKVSYPESFRALIQMFPEKQQAFEKEQLAKKFKEQNPTGDSSEAESLPRDFRELRSQKDYNEVCRSHKACAIALLPAVTTIDYELESFQEKLAILEKIDQKAGRTSSPIHYTWVNATCHDEVFKFFEVDPTMLPTVVFMHVNHFKYTPMIGKFDEESIADHEERFKTGKLALHDVKVDRRELRFSSVDCAAQQMDASTQDDDDFQEILAEILAEEKARKEAEEAETGSAPKKGKKKGKGKGKKGKGKGGNKKEFKSEEL